MSPAELRAILQQTHDLIADSAHWTPRNFAEDEREKWAPVGSENAVRFNLVGSMIRCAGASAREAMRGFAALLRQAPPDLNTTQWGDVRGLSRAQALELLRWALERLSGEVGLSA